MEKYAAVKEKLKKLSIEQTKGDSYDPFMPAQKVPQNGRSRTPHNRPPHVQPHHQADHGSGPAGQQLTIDSAQNSQYPLQEMTVPVAKAIGTLQNRSQNDSQPTAYEDDLIAQEIHRLEILALEINHRSQAQADDILNLKRAAQQAAIAFGRQGIHDHPQLDVITRFFERYTASHVPIVERDDCGHFTISDYTINLCRAEEEAIENAAVLRGNRENRRDTALPPAPAKQPFAQPIVPRTGLQQKSAIALPKPFQPKGNRTRTKTQLRRTLSAISSIWATSLHVLKASTARLKTAHSASLSGTASKGQSKIPTEQYIENYSSGQEFSFIDGAIWFSAAAVVGRIVLKVVAFFPVFQTVLWLVPLSLFCTAIYLLLIAKSSNSTLMYRLVLVALGLFLSSSL